MSLSLVRCWAMLLFVANVANAQDSLSAIASAVAGVKQMVAHRGASSECPENTVASTLRAIEVRATAVEVDVRLSKDRHLVLRHDAELERTTNGKGLIGEKTLAELKELDAGSWFDPKLTGEKIPTLAQVLTVCKGKIDVLLDLKETGDEYAQLVVTAIKEHGEEERTIVGVRSVEQAQQFRKLLPKARQLGLMAKPNEIEAYAAAGVEMIRVWPKWLADDKLVPRVRAAKVKLHLNGLTGKKDEVLPLLAQRPDSLSADDPALLIATLKELASPLRP